MEFLKIVLCFLCFNVLCSESGTYRAAVLEDRPIVYDVNTLTSIIHNGAKLNVDILILPDLWGDCTEEQLKQLQNSVSAAATRSKMYIALQATGNFHGGAYEKLKSNLVFDRNGSIVTTYRKQVNTNTSEVDIFTTDFGVTFGLMMEEHLLYHHGFEGLTNVIALGPTISNLPRLFAKQFPSSWSYSTRTNLITTRQIFGGQLDQNGHLLTAVMDGAGPTKASPEDAWKSWSPGQEDTSEQVVKPLDDEAALLGYNDTICLGHFCCDYYIKASAGSELRPYALVVSDGEYHVGKHAVGVQGCAVVGCLGQNDTCLLQLQNNKTNTVFERLSISGQFTGRQYPVLVASDASYEDIKHDRHDDHHAVHMDNTGLLTFGVFGATSRDGPGPSCPDVSPELAGATTWSGQFFDYVWIRLRVVIVVVSIYVLEMM